MYINELKLKECDYRGWMMLTYGDHIILTTVDRIFNWKSESIDKKSPLRKDIEDQLYNLQCLINKGARRGGK